MNSPTEFVASVDEVTPLKWTILVDSDLIMVSRKVPKELLDLVGFFEWNRCCDRLDEGLEPLRLLAEKADCCQSKESAAKIQVLQALQDACDRQSKRTPYIHFTLFCPLHSKLTENWHIQLIIAEVPVAVVDPPSIEQNAQTDIEFHHSETDRDVRRSVSDSSSDETNNAAAPPGNDHTDPNSQSPIQDEAVVGRSNESACADSPSFLRSSGLGVLGVDYFEHVVQPTDTLSGICLAYNVSPLRLKQTNLLSGDNDSLVLAPKVLAIPLVEGFYSRVQDTNSEDYKLNRLKNECPKLSTKEAKAYLELSDWVLQDALATAKEDIEWEKGNGYS